MTTAGREKSDAIYAQIQREIDKVTSEIGASFAREMFKDDGVHRYPQPAPPKRSLRARLVAWHWRARERIANAIFPRSDELEDD